MEGEFHCFVFAARGPVFVLTVRKPDRAVCFVIYLFDEQIGRWLK